MDAEIEMGPYIPEEHKKYGLLPESRELGGEVFVWPDTLEAIDARIRAHEGGQEEDGVVTNYIIPYGSLSYGEYYGELEGYAAKYRADDPKLADDILALEAAMKAMNVKEQWSVVKFLGSTADSPVPEELDGLTAGQYYYWPAWEAEPEYHGVIDNEEFTTYLYPTPPANWEVALDPTGAAAKALEEGAKATPVWLTNHLMEEEELENEGY